MQTLECTSDRVLFVNKNEHETDFLTRDLPMKVVRRENLDQVPQEIEGDHLKGIFIDVASAEPNDIVNLRRTISRNEVPIFVLAGTDELPLAIEFVRLGAKGFLVKGLSESDSVLKLMQYATSQH